MREWSMSNMYSSTATPYRHYPSSSTARVVRKPTDDAAAASLPADSAARLGLPTPASGLRGVEPSQKVWGSPAGGALSPVSPVRCSRVLLPCGRRLRLSFSLASMRAAHAGMRAGRQVLYSAFSAPREYNGSEDSEYSGIRSNTAECVALSSARWDT